MTLYTRNRRYPYPRDAKEAGNGGLHSEALARAVAADLDVLDAAWPGELQHSTQILTMSADQTGIGTGGDFTVLMNTISAQSTGLGLNSNQVLSVAPGGQGWYHVVAAMRSKAGGTITAAARHRMKFIVYESAFGSLTEREVRYCETYQQGTTDVFNTLEAMVYLGVNDQLRLQIMHTNVGSNVTVVASGTRLAATRMSGA